MIIRILIDGAVFVLIGSATLLCLPEVVEEEIFRYEVVEIPLKSESVLAEPITLLFVGDVMLGRKVEWYMDTQGLSYPFKNIVPFLQKPDRTIGNFEGIVSEEHIPTPQMTFQFSIKKEYLTYLHAIGFDVLSLANNHSLDYGTSSLFFTRELCASSGLICVGTPKGIDSFSSRIIDVKGTKIGFLSLETINGQPRDEGIRSELTQLASSSDIQIVLVHWGTEYVLSHSREQQQLAHKLIEYGADAIIGHHPHVIQDIEIYKEKPIFYSLGNFIFDQYFSTDVQEELGVLMSVTASTTTYTLIPFSSTTTQSQPNFMTQTQKQTLFLRVLQRSVQNPAVHIESGTILVPKN